MEVDILWYVCLALGTVLFSLGILAFFTGRKNIKTAFAKMSILEIVSAWIMIFPDVFIHENNISSFITVVKSIVISLMNVFQIFAGNAYVHVDIGEQTVLSDIYAIVLAVVNISILISLIGFVLQFLGNFLESAVFDLKRFDKVYLFTEVNGKTLSIAGSVKDIEQNHKSEYSIVFVDRSLDGSLEEKKQAIHELGAHYSNTGFEKEVKKLLKRSGSVDVFIFGNSEEDNLNYLNSFAKMDLNEDIAFTRVYVELMNTPWDIYGNFVENNKLPKDKVIVNLVNMDENFVLNDLFDYSVFDHARIDEKTKKRIIDVLIAGDSNKSIEMVKALLPLCQMPYYELRIVMISNSQGCDKIRHLIPELKEESHVLGDSEYSFLFKDINSFDSDEFENVVSEFCPRFTFAFIAGDNNVLNINSGMRLNTLRYRLNNDMDYKIRICVDNSDLICNWMPEIREHIELVGGIKNIYNYEFITMSKIERASEKIHEIRQKDKTAKHGELNQEQKTVSWTEYSNDEFKRRSVYARTLSVKYKLETLKKHGLDPDVFKTDDTWKIYEHMRWNMYTRSLGYVLSDNTAADVNALSKSGKMIAKVHPCLVAFDDLSDDEKSKDSINITDDIENVFHQIR